MCPQCQQQIAELTDQVAEVSFEEAYLDRFIVDDHQPIESIGEQNDDALDINDIIAQITLSDDIDKVEPIVEKTIHFNNKTYTLPAALNNMSLGKISHIGKLSRARIQLNENEIHTSLLQIEPGGGVPQHTHKGFELTLLLDGSFNDESGEYVKGDFIMLDGTHTHNPISAKGCLCYTVANDAFTLYTRHQ